MSATTPLEVVRAWCATGVDAPTVAVAVGSPLAEVKRALDVLEFRGEVRRYRELYFPVGHTRRMLARVVARFRRRG